MRWEKGHEEAVHPRDGLQRLPGEGSWAAWLPLLDSRFTCRSGGSRLLASVATLMRLSCRGGEHHMGGAIRPCGEAASWLKPNDAGRDAKRRAAEV